MAKLKDGFYKLTAEAVGSNSYMLLAGGGSKALSDFVTDLGTNGNYVTWTKNGIVNNLTVPYATKSNKLYQNKDLRNENTLPYASDDYDKSISAPFLRYNSVDGLNDGGLYHTSIIITPWGDSSGGSAHNIGLTNNGNIWIRSGTTEWSNWKKIAFFDEIPTKVSQLTNDSGYLTSTNLTNYVTLNSNLTITGSKTFSTQLKFTVANGTAPFTVTSKTLVANLNADLLDGRNSSDYVAYKNKSINYTEGWYRIAETSVHVGNNIGIFYIYSSGPGYHTNVILGASISYTSIPTLNLLNMTQYSTMSISKARIVYNNSTYAELKAYLDVYIPLTLTSSDGSAKSIQIFVKFVGHKWSLTPIEAATVENTHTTKEISFAKNTIISDYFLGDLIGSASALTTTRKIWGLDFNGTLNVTGNMNGVGTINNRLLLDGSGNAQVHITGVTANTDYIKLQIDGANNNGRNLILQTDGGNVGIGTDSPLYKLHVAGTTSTNLLFIGGSSHPMIIGNESLLSLGAANSNSKASVVLDLNTDSFRRNSASTTISLGTATYPWANIYGDTITIKNYKNFINGNISYPNVDDSYKMGTDLGLISFIGDNGNDTGLGITWSFNTTSAHAGIYTKLSGIYGSKMYFATTNAFSHGPKAALEIDHEGNIKALRGEFKGNLTGNAATANKLTTARTINVTVGGTSGTAQSFDGSKNITIPVSGMGEAYLTWGGKNISGDIGPIDAACSLLFSTNKFELAKAEGITIEYSTNSGSTWLEYSSTDEKKINLVGVNGSSYYYGGSSTASLAGRLRITLNATSMGVYTTLKKLLINFSTCGSSGCTVTMETSKNGSETTFSTVGTYPVSGWAGWNSIPCGFAFGGSSDQTGNTAIIRLTFSYTALGSSLTSNPYVININAIGTSNWSTPSTMAKTGHLYSYDYLGNATFPAKVTATKFIGNLNHTLTFSTGKFAANTYNNSAAVTVNVPTHTSHLTNDSGFLTSRGYIGTTAVQASSAAQNLTGIGNLTMSGNLTITPGNTDNFINFSYSGGTTYSWRLGYLGTGAGDGNYLVIQSAKAAGTSWNNVIRMGNETLDAAFGGNVYPLVNNTQTLGTSSLKWSNVYATTFTGALSGNATTASSAAKWTTARTLTVGNSAKTVDGSANVTWGLHDILYNSSIYVGETTSWDTLTTPGVYGSSTTSTFTGAGNPESANGGLTPYRYGQVIVSRAGTTGMAQFYISHSDSSGGDGASAYGIKFRTGWNNTYLSTWNTILDSSNYTSYTVKKDGTGASGTWGINITGNAATATLASTVTVGSGSSNTYRAIVVHNGNSLYSAGNKVLYNYSTGDVKATSFTGKLNGSLIGGAKGNIIYQSATNTTAFLANPSTNGYVLKFNTSTGLPYWASDNNTTYTLPLAASGTRGGILIGYSESGKNYAVKLASEKAYVYVPWTDTKVTLTNTTTNANYRVLLSNSANDNNTTEKARKSVHLTFNPQLLTLYTGNVEISGEIRTTTSGIHPKFRMWHDTTNDSLYILSGVNDGSSTSGTIHLSGINATDLSNLYLDAINTYVKGAMWVYGGLVSVNNNLIRLLPLSDANYIISTNANYNQPVKLIVCANDVLNIPEILLNTDNLYISGSVTASGEITAYSDRRLKSNIKPLENRGYIQPMTYIKDNKECIGFIAQDVLEKYPELVNDDSEYLSLNYLQYVAVLQALIIELEKRVKELENGTRKL